MLGDSSDRKELGFYMALAQVGLEMVVPLGVGVALDRYLGWRPWGTVGGAILGPTLGVAHLVSILNQHDRSGPSPPTQRET